MKLHIYQSDSGYVFCFANHEKEAKLDVNFSFPTLTNLEPEGYSFHQDTGNKYWHVVVGPGNTETKFVRRQDFHTKFGIAYSLSTNIAPE